MTADATRPSTGSTPLLRWCELAWLGAVLLASSLLIVHTSRTIGPTFDEPFYISKGLDSWRTGSTKAFMRAGTMPLPVDVQTFPLYLWERHQGEPFNTVESLDDLLPVARHMNLPFWWLLLVSGFRLARRWSGPTAAGIASGLLAFEPSLLAHAALATTDIALTAAVLAATNAFVAGRGQSWARRILVPGLWAGFAVLCKASAVTFVPLVFAIVLWRNGEFCFLLRDGLRIGLIAGAVAFGYVGSDWAAEPSFVKWANTLPDGTLGEAVRAVADNLRIFPNAAEGVIQQIKHNIRGHGVYALGEHHARAVWHYFPVVLSQKLTEPVLLLLVGCLLLRPRSLGSPAGVIALALLLFSLTCRVQIGVRLVFPLVAFVLLAVSVSLAWRAGDVSPLLCSSTGGLRPPLAGSIAVLASAAIAFASAPHGLRYQNHLWGGPAKAGQNLTDSNFDWGQGVPELMEWWRANGEPKLTLWYYGTDLNAFRRPFAFVQLHVMPDRSAEFVSRTTGNGYFAVGRTFLTACPDRRPDMLALIDWLNTQPPVAEVGCFRVYRFVE